MFPPRPGQPGRGARGCERPLGVRLIDEDQPQDEPVTGPQRVGPVLVTGAAGNLGAAFIEAADHNGIESVPAGRSPQRLRERFPGKRAARLDFEDPDTFSPALEGVQGVFLIRPPAISRVAETVNAFIDAAVRHRVRHVLFVSVSGADRNPIVPHHRIEKHLSHAGTPHTILRPGFFAQNLGDAYVLDIREDDRIFLPAGRGAVAFIDVRDVGEVAVRVFQDPARHGGHGYELAGPRAHTFDEVAAVLSKVLRRRIAYQPASIPAYVAHLHSRGLSLGQIAVQTILHTRLRNARAEVPEETLEHLLGRTPTSLEQYVRDHRTLWLRQP